MSETNWPDTYRSDDPRFHDPRYQRRIISLRRVIEIVENVHEVTLECGHEPLFLGDSPKPEVGARCFCPECYKASEELR